MNSSNPDLTLSQEILVLDFNEELPHDVPPPHYSVPNSNSLPAYELNNESNYMNGGTRRRGSAGSYAGPNPLESPEGPGTCPTKNSVLVLSVVCGLMLLLYVASLICFMAKSRPWRSGNMMGPPHKHIIQ